MMSISNTPMGDEILDAARECVAEFGIKRTTLAEVARRAGVSRPTVYRRWPDSKTLIAELMTREARSMMESRPPVPAENGRAQTVETVVAGARAIRQNSLFQKVFRTDADLLLTYVVERFGRSQISLRELIADGIKAGQSDGSIRTGDPMQLATMVLLFAQSAVQSARLVEDVMTVDELDRQLAHALDSYLRSEC